MGNSQQSENEPENRRKVDISNIQESSALVRQQQWVNENSVMNSNSAYVNQQIPQNRAVSGERVDDYFGRVLVVGKQEISSPLTDSKHSSYSSQFYQNTNTNQSSLMVLEKCFDSAEELKTAIASVNRLRAMSMNHPNIVRIRQIQSSLTNPECFTKSFSRFIGRVHCDDEPHNLATQFLFSQNYPDTPVLEADIKGILESIAEGLTFCQNQSIIHGDIRGQTVYLTDSNKAKISILQCFARDGGYINLSKVIKAVQANHNNTSKGKSNSSSNSYFNQSINSNLASKYAMEAIEKESYLLSPEQLACLKKLSNLSVLPMREQLKHLQALNQNYNPYKSQVFSLGVLALMLIFRQQIQLISQQNSIQHYSAPQNSIYSLNKATNDITVNFAFVDSLLFKVKKQYSCQLYQILKGCMQFKEQNRFDCVELHTAMKEPSLITDTSTIIDEFPTANIPRLANYQANFTNSPERQNNLNQARNLNKSALVQQKPFEKQVSHFLNNYSAKASSACHSRNPSWQKIQQSNGEQQNIENPAPATPTVVISPFVPSVVLSLSQDFSAINSAKPVFREQQQQYSQSYSTKSSGNQSKLLSSPLKPQQPNQPENLKNMNPSTIRPYSSSPSQDSTLTQNSQMTLPYPYSNSPQKTTNMSSNSKSNLSQFSQDQIKVSDILSHNQGKSSDYQQQKTLLLTGQLAGTNTNSMDKTKKKLLVLPIDRAYSLSGSSNDLSMPSNRSQNSKQRQQNQQYPFIYPDQINLSTTINENSKNNNNSFVTNKLIKFKITPPSQAKIDAFNSIANSSMQSSQKSFSNLAISQQIGNQDNRKNDTVKKAANEASINLSECLTTKRNNCNNTFNQGLSSYSTQSLSQSQVFTTQQRSQFGSQHTAISSQLERILLVNSNLTTNNIASSKNPAPTVSPFAKTVLRNSINLRQSGQKLNKPQQEQTFSQTPKTSQRLKSSEPENNNNSDTGSKNFGLPGSSQTINSIGNVSSSSNSLRNIEGLEHNSKLDTEENEETAQNTRIEEIEDMKHCYGSPKRVLICSQASSPTSKAKFSSVVVSPNSKTIRGQFSSLVVSPKRTLLPANSQPTGTPQISKFEQLGKQVNSSLNNSFSELCVNPYLQQNEVGQNKDQQVIQIEPDKRFAADKLLLSTLLTQDKEQVTQEPENAFKDKQSPSNSFSEHQICIEQWKDLSEENNTSSVSLKTNLQKAQSQEEQSQIKQQQDGALPFQLSTEYQEKQPQIPIYSSLNFQSNQINYVSQCDQRLVQVQQSKEEIPIAKSFGILTQSGGTTTDNSSSQPTSTHYFSDFTEQQQQQHNLLGNISVQSTISTLKMPPKQFTQTPQISSNVYPTSPRLISFTNPIITSTSGLSQLSSTFTQPTATKSTFSWNRTPTSYAVTPARTELLSNDLFPRASSLNTAEYQQNNILKSDYSRAIPAYQPMYQQQQQQQSPLANLLFPLDPSSISAASWQFPLKQSNPQRLHTEGVKSIELSQNSPLKTETLSTHQTFL